MPELPEVEATRLSLAPHLPGARVQAVRIGRSLRWPLGVAPERLVGLRAGEVLRRGKYLWIPLLPLDAPAAADGPGLLLHLGMSGSLRFAAQVPAAGPHDHFDLVTDRGVLRLNDPRRFGAVVWAEAKGQGLVGRLLAGLGVEPLSAEFQARRLHDGLRGRRVAIKQALLAGDLVVGVGNIYCSEALFAAGIDPRSPAGRISLPRCERLVDAIRATLQRALALGGSTLRNFSNADGMGGLFQQQAQVYGRVGLPCRVCGTAVRRIVQGQRASYFCPRCQKR